MCGRQACTLAPDLIQKACCTFDNSSKSYKPLEWNNLSNGGLSYQPSFNICPTSVTPVIVNKDGQQTLQPMIWGMIPPWHKGNYNDHKLSTNNCRIESILESKLYKEPMLVGKRCVVVCDGFYEWQTTKGKTKQPYFVYAQQPEGVQITNFDSAETAFSEKTGWTGGRLLYMAALYNKWTSPQGDETWSYSIVTMESDSHFDWLHHRVPAILHSEALVDVWLSKGALEPQQILGELLPSSPLAWHPVSTKVNNSRDKSEGLNKAIDLNAIQKPSKSAAMMESWLQKAKRKSDENEDCDSKKKKGN